MPAELAAAGAAGNAGAISSTQLAAASSGMQSASGLIQNFANLGFGLLTNRSQRKYNEKQYARQRADALSDWAMQNEYNHPSNQMARLRMAGLNPNLVYDKGAAGLVASTGVRNSESKSYSPLAPRLDLSQMGGSLATFQDMQLRDAQISNLRKQNTIMDTKAAIELLNLDMKGIDSKFKERLTEGKYDLLLNQISKLSHETDNVITQGQISAENLDIIRQTKAETIQQAVERTLQMQLSNAKTKEETSEIKQRILSISNDVRLKELDIALKEMGLQPTDELWQRIAALATRKYLGDFKLR